MKNLLFFFSLISASPLLSQSYVVRDIKSFGAKGNGKADDHNAFVKAAEFFNQRGGHGKLVISTGVYIVGRQRFTKNPAAHQDLYNGEALMHFKKTVNLVIEGTGNPVIRYRSGLRFGTFSPESGEPLEKGRDFYQHSHAGAIKNAIYLSDCRSVQIRDLELDGNREKILLGGGWGDVGRQLPHSGIVLENTTKVAITQVRVHHFALDGLIVSNATGDSAAKDSIVLRKSLFEYNGRQGLSWVGGNDLTAIQCGFNHTGRGKFYSPPGAGVDIEAEVGLVKNGKFVQCEFVNNTGCGVVADQGPGSDCAFTDCTFWGITAWSIWTVKPGFRFENCTVYGSMVHGYNSPTDEKATTFLNCRFEDKPYKGQEPYGQFLIESNHAGRMRIESCTFIAHKKKIAWLDAPPDFTMDQKYKLFNCVMRYEGNHLGERDFVVLVRGVRYKNCTFEMTHPAAKSKRYYFEGLSQGSIDLGGNQFIIR